MQKHKLKILHYSCNIHSFSKHFSKQYQQFRLSRTFPVDILTFLESQYAFTSSSSHYMHFGWKKIELLLNSGRKNFILKRAASYYSLKLEIWVTHLAHVACLVSVIILNLIFIDLLLSHIFSKWLIVPHSTSSAALSECWAFLLVSVLLLPTTVFALLWPEEAKNPLGAWRFIALPCLKHSFAATLLRQLAVSLSESSMAPSSIPTLCYACPSTLGGEKRIKKTPRFRKSPFSAL